MANGAGMGVDEVAFYGTALTATQVSNHYFAALSAIPKQAAFPANAVMQLKPVAYYRLGESNSNQAMADSSGNGNHGYYTGGTFGNASVYSRTVGSGLDADTSYTTASTSNYGKVNISNPGNAKLQFTSKMSASFWIYDSNGTSGSSYSVDWMGVNGVSSTGFCQWYGSGPCVSNAAVTGSVFLVVAGSTTAYLSTAPHLLPYFNNIAGSLSTGWHHFAYAIDLTQSTLSQQVRYYIDGVLYPMTLYSGTMPAAFNPSTSIQIGYNGSTYALAQQNAGMLIDEVAYYNYPLTAQQVNAIYYDASFRQCQTNSITTAGTTPSNSTPYDFFSLLYNGTTANFFHNGQQECSLHLNSTASPSNVTLNTDTSAFTLGATTGGAVGNLYSASLYGANGVTVAAATEPVTNFNVTGDKFRPQTLGAIRTTNLFGWYEPAAANDGLRPWDNGISSTQTLWRDLSPYANNGLLYNMTSGNGWQGSGVPATDPYRIAFTSGLSQFVDLGQNLGPNNSVVGTSSMSACTWVKSSSYAVSQIFVGKDKAVTTGGFYLATSNTTANKVQLGMLSGSSAVVTSTSILDSNWHYVCGTYDGSNLRIYIDGNYNAKTAYTAAIVGSTDDLAIGCGVAQGKASSANCFTGSLGGVHLYTDALSSTMIYNNCVAQAANYTSTAPTTFCTLYGTDYP